MREAAFEGECPGRGVEAVKEQDNGAGLGLKGGLETEKKASGGRFDGAFGLEGGADGEEGFEFAGGAAATGILFALGAAEPARGRVVDDGAIGYRPRGRTGVGKFKEKHGAAEADFVARR